MDPVGVGYRRTEPVKTKRSRRKIGVLSVQGSQSPSPSFVSGVGTSEVRVRRNPLQVGQWRRTRQSEQDWSETETKGFPVTQEGEERKEEKNCVTPKSRTEKRNENDTRERKKSILES